VDRHADFDKNKLFLISVIALVTAGLAFSLRGATASDLQKFFFDPIDAAHATERIGAVAGWAFLGFAASIFVGSPLCDILGMGRLLGVSALCFLAGTAGLIFQQPSASPDVILAVCMFVIGLGHGLVEAVINPLIATLYPEEKVHKLNVLHAWWPGGLMLGGLLAVFLGSSGAGLSWQMRMAIPIVPAILFGVMLLGTKFPPTERVAAGVSNGEMLKDAFNPLFLLLAGCMLLTAASELAPGQWVDSMLTRVVGFQGILLLVYISGLMFVMRFFAGNLAHKLSPIGLMCFSCILAAIGLFLLATANSPILALLAATVWGVGVCYMWPTMLGITSERFPKGGALSMGLMGCVGNISIFYVLPWMGKIFDNAKEAAATAKGTSFAALSAAKDSATSPQLNEVLQAASATAFKAVAILPAVLILVFGAWWLADKAKGGYKAVKLAGSDDELTPPLYEG
jgi:MFS family permease